jgi:hypothetical protein
MGEVEHLALAEHARIVAIDRHEGEHVAPARSNMIADQRASDVIAPAAREVWYPPGACAVP